MTRRRDQRGAVLPLLALCVVVITLATGFTVDLGRVASTSRRMQAIADLLALDTSNELIGQSCGTKYAKAGETSQSSVWDHLRVAMLASAARNRLTDVSGLTLEALEVTRNPDGSVARDARGEPIVTVIPTCSTPGNAEVPDAVRVTSQELVSYGFARVVGFEGTTPRRDAVALHRAVGAFSIGSSLTGLSATNETILDRLLTVALCSTYKLPTGTSPGGTVSGVTNPLFAAAGGGSTNAFAGACNVDLSLVGYQGLATADVSLGDVATRLGFASAEQLLASDVAAGTFFIAAANAVDCTGQPSSCSAAKTNLGALGSMLASSSGGTTIGAGQLARVGGALGAGSAADLDVSLLDVLVGSAEAVNGVNFLSVGNLNVGIGTLSNSRLTVDVIEPAQRYEGRIGFGATTAQTRITLDTTATLPLGVISGVTSATLSVRLRISAIGGGATGTLTGIRCKDPTKGIDVAVQTIAVQPTVEPTAGTVAVALPLLGSSTLTATITATTAVVGGSAQTLSFLFPSEYLEGGASPKHVGGSNLGLGASGLSVTLGGGSLSSSIASSIRAAIGVNLTSLLGTIDTSVLSPISLALGLEIGSADVIAVEPLRCGAQTIIG